MSATRVVSPPPLPVPSFARWGTLPALGLRSSRRESSRREVVLPCQAVREHDFTLVADRTLDISTHGLLLPLRRRVLTGEPHRLVRDPGLVDRRQATVARVVHGRRPGDDGLAIGVLFDRIAPAAQAALAGFLHGRRAPLPRRGPLACLRRGAIAPHLADEGVMATPLADPMDVMDVMDVVDVMDVEEGCEDKAVDGLGVLRAVVGAWQSLSLAQV